MGGYTDRWALSILGPGDSFSDDGYKFSDADIRLLDRILAWAAESHHHSGATGSDNTPDAAPGVAVATTGGAFPAGGRYYYAITVVDADGNESGPSPSIHADMPVALSPPPAPSPSYVSGTGDLQPGTYSYVLSAYQGPNSRETKALNSVAITVAGSNVHNEVSLILPALPTGADGFNIYRKASNGLHFLYLESIASPDNGDVWVDDGSIEGDCDRSLPSANQTAASNMVTVTYPGATPSLPDNWTWRIYRTADPSDWSRSYLTELVWAGATPTIPFSFEDIGGGTQIGGPPTRAQLINSPSQIELTNAAEVTGTLPPGRIVFPFAVTFTFPGPVTVGQNTYLWTCPYDLADVISVRAHLGTDSVPAAQAVIADVLANRPSVGETSFASIFDADWPQVPISETIGTPAIPARSHLQAGDLLTASVLQDGGGATPTDQNLTVSVLLYGKSGSETTSYPWS